MPQKDNPRTNSVIVNTKEKRYQIALVILALAVAGLILVVVGKPLDIGTSLLIVGLAITGIILYILTSNKQKEDIYTIIKKIATKEKTELGLHHPIYNQEDTYAKELTGDKLLIHFKPANTTFLYDRAQQLILGRYIGGIDTWLLQYEKNKILEASTQNISQQSRKVLDEKFGIDIQNV